MSDVLEQAQNICRNLLDMDLPVTIEKIRDSISRLSLILPLTAEDKEKLFSRLVQNTGISQEAPKILDNDHTEPWVIEKWASGGDRKFWRRYRDYMAEKSLSPKVLQRLDEVTDNILDRLADPTASDEFDKRGLVVGHVQSGKTSNYIGLINKAADAGYKMIIVLAGIHSSLRSQTQLRIDEGFLGYDTLTSRCFDENNTYIGVGKIDRKPQARSLTSSGLDGDFKKSIANTLSTNLGITEPVVVVIKKNSSVLKNLINWLAIRLGEVMPDKRRIINTIPLLLIDDEADNASINISKDSVSAINGAIRALLQLFRKSAYVGYTATPFANVFIPAPEKVEKIQKGLKLTVGNRDYPLGEDLFPRDFIINIVPPSNYVGPEKFFGIVSEDQLYEQEERGDNPDAEPVNLYEWVKDYQPVDYADSAAVVKELRKKNSHFIPDRHDKNDAMPEELPESLKYAIRCFILTCAARRARGQYNVHNSMLVHVTRFINWQNHIALLVQDELNRYKNKIEFRDSDFLVELKEIWEKDYEPRTQEILKRKDLVDSEMTPVCWKEVEVELYPAVAKIRVRAVHGSKLLGGLEPENIQALDYYENRTRGLSVIAVGGNKLSRGLTLEGLSVSYYLRASKMYDTLMQMGRWFGYRNGYLDLCRLFTSSELVSYYKFITAASEQMRAEFDRMCLLKSKPKDYGLKVRAHTGVLVITAANKFRYKKMMYFSFSGELEETWQFDKKNKESFEKNYQSTDDFIHHLGEPQGPRNTGKALINQPFVWHGKNNYKEVMNFLENYRSLQPSFRPELMKEYIEKQAANGKLTNWTIALVNNSKVEPEDIGGYCVGLSYRKDTAEVGSQYYELSKAHIIGSFHEYIDLTNEELSKAIQATVDDKLREGDTSEVKHPSPMRIREQRPEENGLLLIYPLNPRPNPGAERYSEVPIIGLALSFPDIKGDEKVLYAVNRIYEDRFDYPEAYDREDIAEEEDESKVALTERNLLEEETFHALIENNHRNRLDETEILSGVSPERPKTDNPLKEAESVNDLLVPSDLVTVREGQAVPFYPDKEIQKYYLEKTPGYILLSPQKGAVVSGKYIVGLKRSKYVTFCYHDQSAAFSDGCWIIKAVRWNAGYLVALFNSTIFGAWVRVCGEQKKDTYFISHEVLTSFPMVFPDEKQLWLYDNLYELLVAAGKKEEESGAGVMKAYFSGILDALIFVCYFPGSLSEQAGILYEHLGQLIPRELPVGEERAALAERIYATLYARKHPVREVLYYLDSQNKVNRIKSVFTR